MRLVVDRFVLDHDRSSGFALDLATRSLVWIEIHTAAAARAHREWMIRCDELFRLRHPALAALVDYGLIGSQLRFEAWAADSVWRGTDAAPRATASRAARFLAAVGIAEAAAWRLLAKEGRPVGVPSIEPQARAVPVDSTGIPDTPGIALIDRAPLRSVAEMIHDAVERRPRVAALWGPHGAGLRTALLTLAREARTNGLVPIDAELLQSHQHLVHGRSLLTIDRRAHHVPATLLRAGLAAGRAHVHLIVSSVEQRGIDSVRLRGIAPAALLASVRPSPTLDVVRRRMLRAAERADGLPGRFVKFLWTEYETERAEAVRASRVAEQTACYGSEAPAGESASFAPAPSSDCRWPAPGELAALRRRVEQAHALLAAGRHAPGIRLLRQAIGGLARRSAWTNAAQAALTLASELAVRGRPRDALRVLDEARDHASRAGDDHLLLDIAIKMGECRIDGGRLDDAERVLAAAQTSARSAGDSWRAAAVAVTLGRCLFWRGDYADAAAALDLPIADVDPPSTIVGRLRLAASVAIAQGESMRALAAVDEARTRAQASGDAKLRADVEHTSAFVKLNLGDLDGVRRDAAACITFARGARHPIRGFCARLLHAEADRRQQKPRGAADIAALRRLSATMPPIIKCRWDLLCALTDAADEQAALARQTYAAGLKALELFAPLSARRQSARTDLSVAEVVDILQVCQNADDELAVLREVCGRVRRQLHAAGAAIAVRQGSRVDLVAAEGARVEPGVGARALEVGIAVGPQRVDDRVEAAAPIQYAGSSIGAVCARWTIGTTHDLSRAAGVLSMTAAAAAPVLAAIVARQSQTARTATIELIGVTPAMNELRRAVESAALAPYPVLVEGESGSGKELVARGIHRASPRRDRAFCTLNCAALPDELIESELFGHARGAFTGAAADRAGVFEEAHGGTLFLDEVGELSPRAQAKLLRVLQEGELRRIGENIARRVDARIVAATNRDLRREVEAGRFRLDLLYRLDVIRITVPALRDRREDVAALVDHFWSDATRRTGSRAALAAATRGALASYDWPGNVRELQNVLAALAVRSPKRGVVAPAALPPHVVNVRRPEVWRLDAARRTFEESFVRAALVRAGGHRGRAADELGVTRQGLTKLLARLGIE